MIADEYDAAQVLLAAHDWPGDMDDDSAIIEATIEILMDEYDGMSLENLTNLLTRLAPLCVSQVSPLTGAPLIGFGHKGVLLLRAVAKATGDHS